jgi:hypothetical protein
MVEAAGQDRGKKSPDLPTLEEAGINKDFAKLARKLAALSDKEFERMLAERHERAHDISEEFHTYTNKAAMDGANVTLRTLIVINGGAAIAILTFLGGVASKDKIDFTKVGAVADDPVLRNRSCSRSCRYGASVFYELFHGSS